MTAAAKPAPSSPAHRTQQLVLLGAGGAHVQVLAQLAAHPLPGVVVTLVAPDHVQIDSGMVAGLMAGHYTLKECAIPLEPLVQRGGIRWVQHKLTALDAQRQTLQLDDGSTLPFDWLSINTGPTQDREQIEREMPGAREHALFVRPIETFSAFWTQVALKGDARPLRIAVIGAGGIELALAARHRLPTAAVTLVCGLEPPGANYPPKMQQRLLAVLKRRRVTVLQDVAMSFKTGLVQLGCGAELACDIPVLAMDALAPQWLAGSGLALDEQGFLAVDMYQRSTSHSRVFAAGEVSTRMDRPIVHSGANTVRAGLTLARNLAAATAGAALQPHQLPRSALNLLSCGDRYAVGSWGNFSAQGRWVWWLKDWVDRRLMARHSKV